jgi:Flp pilus assembly protein TadG
MSRKHFFRNRSGAAAIEFIIVIPVFLFLLLGVIEVGRLILVQQKVGRAAFSFANTLASASSANTTQEMSDIFASLHQSLSPFYDSSDGTGTIITAFNQNGSGNPQKVFQCRSSSSVSGISTLDSSIITLDPGEGVFVVEVNLMYTSMTGFYTSYLGNNSVSQIKARHIIRPRDGGLISNTACP